MKKLQAIEQAARTAEPGDAEPAAPMVRLISRVADGGQVFLAVGADEVAARIVAELADHDPATLAGREALVVYEGGDPGRPIVVALMAPTGEFARAMAAADESGDDEPERHVTIRAGEKLELRVGKASIVIDAEGKITLRGAHLYQRATGPIRIKGGHIDLN